MQSFLGKHNSFASKWKVSWGHNSFARKRKCIEWTNAVEIERMQMFYEWTQSFSRSFSKVLRECRSIDIYHIPFAKFLGRNTIILQASANVFWANATFLERTQIIELFFFNLLLSFDILGAILYPLEQGCSNLVLEGRCPAEFCSNLPQHTCMEASSMPSKSLISCFRCV